MQCLIITFSLCCILAVVGADYPGVIELVGYSNRRARTHYMPPAAATATSTSTITDARNLPAAKMQADIETVKQNIEKYNKLLTLDTKHLPDSQKDMLERIVERVARLKESLDIEVQQAANANAAATQSILDDTATVTTESQGISMEAETDVNQLLDETTLLQFQTSMEELAQAATAGLVTTTPVADISDFSSAITTDLNSEIELETDTDPGTGTGTEKELILSTTPEILTDATDVDDQFVAARSNNNLAAITADDSETAASTVSGSQRTLTTSKLSKTRSTRRPQATATKPVSNTPNKRVSSRPAGGGTSNNIIGTGTGPVSGTGSTGGIQKQNIGTSSNKQKPVGTTTGYTTAQPQYSKLNGGMQQKPLPQQKITSQTISDKMSSATPLTVTEQRITGTTITNNVPTLNAVGYGVGNTNANLNSPNNNNNNDLVYDAPHVNTSSIIDSLNHAREEYYQQKLSGNLKDKVRRYKIFHYY